MAKRVSGSILVNGVIDGTDGRDAAVLEIYSGNPAVFSTDSSGVTIGAQTKDVLLRIRTAGGTVVPTTGNITVGSTYYDISITKPSNGKVRLSIAADKTVYEGSVVVTAKGTIGGVSYTAVGAIIVVCNRMGLRGDVGPWIYYDGPWSATKYYNKTAGTPYVLAADGLKYILSADSSNNQDPRTNNNGNPWELMTSSFKYFVAEMVFANNAQFGAFVFNTDWLISISGKINGTRYVSSAKDSPAMVTVSGLSVPAYTRFNPAMPNGKMDVPLTSPVVVSSATTNNAYFNILGSHTYYIDVTISSRSSSDVSKTVEIKLCDSSSDYAFLSKTVDHNGTFTLGPLSPNSDLSLKVCCKCSSGLTATVDAVLVRSTTVFVPNYAVDGLTGRTYQNEANVSGEVTANRLFSGNGDFTTEITPGLVEFRSVKYPQSFLKIGADSYGMVFQMTDKDGRMIWNLGGSSNGIGSIQSGGGDYTTVYYKKMSGENPSVSEFSHVSQEDCTAYYRYNGQWAMANGDRVFNTGEEDKNGIVHKTQVSGIDQNLIDDGYYVVPNNGIFMTKIQEQEGSGEQKRIVFLYQFASGKITRSVSKEF